MKLFLVDAASKADAIAAFNRGEATFEDETVEVTSLDDVTEDDVESVED